MRRTREWRLGSRTLFAESFLLCFSHSCFSASVSGGSDGDAASVLVPRVPWLPIDHFPFPAFELH